MKLKIALLTIPFIVYSCVNDPKTSTKTLETPAISSVDFKLSEGNCDTNCAAFNLSYPQISKGSPALRDSVQAWVENKIRDYSISSEEMPSQRVSIEQAAKEFIGFWKTGGSSQPFSFELKDTVIAATAKYVTLRLDIYSYTGGAHPNYASEFAVFDAETGKMSSKSAFIKNEAAILPMLDIAYRAEKREAFEAGMEYEGGQISFPTQCAISEKGILFHYNTYEIGPYAMGDADIFLTWTDLGDAAINPFQ